MGTVLSALVVACTTLVILVFTVGLSSLKRYIYFHPEMGNRMRRDLPAGVLELRHQHLSALCAPGAPEAWRGPIVLFCHGNAGNVYSRLPKLEALTALGYSVLLFDYSGYGRSTGEPSEQQCYDDADMMCQYAQEKLGFEPSEIAVYGESLGGPIAAYVAAKHGLPCLILESALPSVPHLIKARLPSFLGFLGFLFPEFNIARNLQSEWGGYRGHILHMHSPDDEIIPYACTGELRCDTTEHIALQGGHNNPVIPWGRVGTFLGNALPLEVRENDS